MKKYEKLFFTIVVKNDSKQWTEDYKYNETMIIDWIGLQQFNSYKNDPHKLALLLGNVFVDYFNSSLTRNEKPRELIEVKHAIFII